MRRSPLKAKRETPRRNAGRVTHERMKRKPRDEPNREERQYHAWLRAKGACEACGRRTGLVIHHVLSSIPPKAVKRDHWFVVLICSGCHNGDTNSVHLLGSEALFEDETGVDLVAISMQRLEEYRALV